ncbi:MAG: hypothetical protein IKS98_13340 [Lachnospiraceae bacterium]|nr:hypothetical protein [Lachnospiraceae bacterium]
MRASDSQRSVRAQIKMNGLLEFIVDVNETLSFVEIVGRFKESKVTYRVYDDGTVTKV